MSREHVFHRTVSATDIRRRDTGDPDLHEYSFRCSSPNAVRMGDFEEILLHEADNVRLDFLASGNAPLLKDHDRRSQIGVVRSAEVRPDGVAVTVRMSPNAVGEVRDIEADVLRNVSIGYRIHAEERSEDGSTFRVSDWEPMEVSFVSIPADPSVGLGRAEDALALRSLHESTNPPQSMPEEPKAAVVAEPPENAKKQVEAERRRAAQIHELAAKAETNGWGSFSDAAEDHIRDGKPVADFQRHILENVPKTPPVTGESIGLTERELERYSLHKVIAGIANGDLDRRAPHELEVSHALQDAADREHKNVAVPPEVLLRGWVPKKAKFRDYVGLSKRDLVSVTLSGAGQTDTGSNVVETELLSEMFIESLRENSAVLDMGVTILPGLQGDAEIPVEVTNPSFYWVGEGTAPTEGTYGLSKASLTFRTVAAKIPFTRRARKQSTPAIEGLLTRNLRKGLAIAIETAIINGAGGSEPTGILNTAGIGSVTTSGTLTRSNFRELRKALGDANVDVSQAAGICGSAEEYTITDTLLDAGSGQFIGNITGAGSLSTIIGPFRTTNIIPAGNIIFGVWSSAICGMWGGVEIDRDTATGADAGDVYLRFFQDLDVVIPQAAQFAAITDL